MNDERNLQSLFDSSRDEGSLSDQSHQLLTLPDLGAKIQQGLGIAVDDVPVSEVFTDIRTAFRVIGQIAVRTSQGGGQFARVEAGGFGA